MLTLKKMAGMLCVARHINSMQVRHEFLGFRRSFAKQVFISSLMIASTLGLNARAATETPHLSLVQNPNLLVSDATQAVPQAWRIDGTVEQVAVDDTMRRNGQPSLRFKFKSGAPYAGVIQRLNGSELRGETLIVEGWVARNSANSPVGVWIRAIGDDKKSVGYANTYEEPVPTDGSFVRHIVKFTVPQETNTLLVGASIWGEDGTAWFSFVDLYEVKPPAKG